MAETMTKAQAQDALDLMVANRRSLVIQQKTELDALKARQTDQLKVASAGVTKAKRRCGSVAAAESVSKAEATAARAARAAAKPAAQSEQDPPPIDADGGETIH